MGSLSLTTRKPLLNGKVDTIEKISKDGFNSNICFESSALSPNRKTANSKFSAGLPGFNIQETGGEESPSKGMMKRKSNYDDLHKKVIINNLQKKEIGDKGKFMFEEEKRTMALKK